MPPQEKAIRQQTAGEGENTMEQPPSKPSPLAFANQGFVDTENNNDGSKKIEETSEKSDDAKPFEFDDLLPFIGEFGIYQKILFLMMIPFACSVAFVYFTQIFITVIPDGHWCWVPELANLTAEQRKILAIPFNGQEFDKCRMYDVNFEELLKIDILKPDPSWPVKSCQNGWEYDFTDQPYTSIATEQNWVCENAALPHTAQAIFFGGAILGGLIFGWLADRFGRIPALVGSNLVGFISGIATTLCSSFLGFCICRFLVGMAFDNCFTMMYILVLEYVGPKYRTFVANMSIAIFFTFAATILPWIAYYLADWKMLCYVTSAPLLVSVFAAWFIPESARWLTSQGKFDKAIGILRRFEKFNKKTVDEAVYDKFKSSCLKIQKEEEMEKTYTVFDLFRTPRLRRTTFVLIILWMCISLVFDGHVRNVGSLGLDLFLTFTIASFTEFPADTFLTMVLDVWGRRWLAFGSMVISGVFSLLATTVPIGIPSATLAIIGRFAVNISYNIGLQYAAELLPTVVRAQGVALIHIMGYVASILAPFVVYLANISPSLPLFILGILGIVGGVLALFLPETLDQELPQTLQDGESFGMDQGMWDFPCIKKNDDEESVGNFKRSSSKRNSLRASGRGEIRSSMVNRSSLRSRAIPENQSV